MPDYKAMYHTLFNGMTNADRIIQASQRATEELYTSADDEQLTETAKDEPDNKD